jgi:hypothetical protein
MTKAVHVFVRTGPYTDTNSIHLLVHGWDRTVQLFDKVQIQNSIQIHQVAIVYSAFYRFKNAWFLVLWNYIQWWFLHNVVLERLELFVYCTLIQSQI